MPETVEVEGRTIKVSSLDAVMFPTGETKGDVIAHYERVAPFAVPHLRARPLTLKRFPDGIEPDGKGTAGFFQKAASKYFPTWIDRVEVPTAKEPQIQVTADSAAALVYLANQRTVELHPWLSRRDHLFQPDRLIVDLDPPEGLEVAFVRGAVHTVGGVLDELQLTWFLQTSGSKGFHLVVPLVPDGDHEAVLRVAGFIAAESVRRDPDGLTVEFTKAERGQRIYVDIGRNGPAQTSAAPYSLRARPGAPVATPIEHDELDAAEPQSWNLRTIADRLERMGDPWAGIDDHANELPEVP